MLYWEHTETKERLPYMPEYQRFAVEWWEHELLTFFPAILVDTDED